MLYILDGQFIGSISGNRCHVIHPALLWASQRCHSRDRHIKVLPSDIVPTSARNVAISFQAMLCILHRFMPGRASFYISAPLQFQVTVSSLSYRALVTLLLLRFPTMYSSLPSAELYYCHPFNVFHELPLYPVIPPPCLPVDDVSSLRNTKKIAE